MLSIVFSETWKPLLDISVGTHMLVVTLTMNITTKLRFENRKHSVSFTM